MEPLLRLGEIEFASGRYLESLSLFARARREHPDRTEPRLDLAGLYKTHFILTDDRQYLDGAERELEAALQMDPGNAGVRGALGEVLYMGSKTRRAAQELSRAVAEDPSLLSARVVLASLYARSGRQRLDSGGPEAEEQAQQFAQLALALDTGLAGPHLLMADVLRVKKDFSPAQEHLLKAESLQPDDPEMMDAKARFYRDLGFALLLSGRKPDAFEAFGKAVATEAPNTDLAQVKAILTRGEAEAVVPEEAVAPEVAAVLRERSEQARLAFMEAVRLRGERDFDGAVRAILESLTALETAEGRYVLGQIRHDQGKEDEAERAFRAAVKQKPGLYQAWLDLGTLLYFQGDDPGALECYENYLHLAGEGDPVETRAAVQAKVKQLRESLDGK
jgi:tetratricopeptide (TPR) repeat protein